MNSTAVNAQDLQNMLNVGAAQVVENYKVFRKSFPDTTVYMSELGMTDIIMAYGQQWATDNKKTAVWAKTGNESVKGSDFHVHRKTGVDAATQDLFEIVYFQAKTTKINPIDDREYADFLFTSASGKFQNLLLEDYVAAEIAEGRPSRGYYICYGPNGVKYVAVEKIREFITKRSDKKNVPYPPADVAWNVALYGGQEGQYNGLVMNRLVDATNLVVN